MKRIASHGTIQCIGTHNNIKKMNDFTVCDYILLIATLYCKNTKRDKMKISTKCVCCCMCVCVCMCAGDCMWKCVRMCQCASVYIYVYKRECMYLCAFTENNARSKCYVEIVMSSCCFNYFFSKVRYIK